MSPQASSRFGGTPYGQNLQPNPGYAGPRNNVRFGGRFGGPPQGGPPQSQFGGTFGGQPVAPGNTVTGVPPTGPSGPPAPPQGGLFNSDGTMNLPPSGGGGQSPTGPPAGVTGNTAMGGGSTNQQMMPNPQAQQADFGQRAALLNRMRMRGGMGGGGGYGGGSSYGAMGQ